MGLSCGNPLAFASLRAGETVLDLGSGGGFDCFMAATKVGRRGRVIGVDMTPEMLAKARANTNAFEKRTGLANVEFRLGEIERLPVADASVDVVISNCVMNLSRDKPQVWREIARVLRPGGRVAISDLALLRPLPPALKKSVAALTGCIAGAALVRDVVSMARRAGLIGISTAGDANRVAAIAAPYGTARTRGRLGIPNGRSLTDYVTSLYIVGRKRR
jgi:SAM-dependent methyltransferase